jgi:hypothetical protein
MTKGMPYYVLLVCGMNKCTSLFIKAYNSPKCLFMSDIINDQSTLRKGKHFQRKTQLRIDMTPMVDLGFLLVSFFIFTTIV